MILVDYRQGSAELVTPLKRLGLPVEKTTLDFGDLAWEGRGAHGQSVDIGVEFKLLPELVQSLRSGRLVGHQLLGMRGAEAGTEPLYDFAWLVVEGQWRTDKRGQVCTRVRRGWKPVHGQMSGGELEKQLLTLQLCGGLNVRFTSTRTDTLRVLSSLYRWWTDTDLDRHTSHLAIYHPPTLVPISDFRRVVKALPDVGMKVSLAAQKKFKSLRRAFNATEGEWAELTAIDDNGKARKLGARTASRIVRIITEEN